MDIEFSKTHENHDLINFQINLKLNKYEKNAEIIEQLIQKFMFEIMQFKSTTHIKSITNFNIESDNISETFDDELDENMDIDEEDIVDDLDTEILDIKDESLEDDFEKELSKLKQTQQQNIKDVLIENYDTNQIKHQILNLINELITKQNQNIHVVKKMPSESPENIHNQLFIDLLKTIGITLDKKSE
jgi:hypothetical protein